MRIARALVLCLLPSLAGAQSVQRVEILHEFTTAPSRPTGPLVEVPDGSFYGLTSDAIYRRAPDGQVSIVARLDAIVGASGPLAIGPDGALYGTTQWGGASGQGTVFRYDPVSSAVRVVHTFTGAREGTTPLGGVTVH